MYSDICLSPFKGNLGPRNCRLKFTLTGTYIAVDICSAYVRCHANWADWHCRPVYSWPIRTMQNSPVSSLDAVKLAQFDGSKSPSSTSFFQLDVHIIITRPITEGRDNKRLTIENIQKTKCRTQWYSYVTPKYLNLRVLWVGWNLRLSCTCYVLVRTRRFLTVA